MGKYFSREKRELPEEVQPDPVDPDDEIRAVGKRISEEQLRLHEEQKRILEEQQRIAEEEQQQRMESPICSEKGLLSLPPELLLPILQQLSHRSLCQVVLTCRYLRQIGSDPDLWAEMPINRAKVRDHGMVGFYTIPRFSKLGHLNLADFMDSGVEGGLHLTATVLTEVLWYVNIRSKDGNSLESLDLTWAKNLGDLSTELLSTALSQVRILVIGATNLSKQQIDAIFEKIPLSGIMQELTFHENLGALFCPEWKKIDPHLLAEAFCSLRKVDADSTSMNTEQLIALFSRSLSSDTLEELNMYDSNLTEVSCELLNKAICRLRSVDLGYCLGYGSGSHEQITSLFSAIPTSTILQTIKFYNADMSQIDPVIMARGVCHVPCVELRYLRLTITQLYEIVRCKLNEKDNLKELDLSQNDFSNLTECYQLGQAVAGMRKVNLERTGLTSEQITAILRAIQELVDETSTILEELCFGESDVLNRVPGELLMQKFVRPKF